MKIKYGDITGFLVKASYSNYKGLTNHDIKSPLQAVVGKVTC